MNTLTRIPFHGTDIVVDADKRVVFRPLCETLGLDYSGQLQRVKRQPWATVGMTPTVGADGKKRDAGEVA